MNNPFIEYNKLIREAIPTCAKYLPPGAVERSVKEIEEKIETKNLHIMFFGAYNAGKSTIINALLGKESAAVKDIPTTDRIDTYNWNGYVLIDSPGVNAPIEHEKVSEAQLDRSDLIAFVIRQGEQDVKDVYERMFDLIERKKKIFIILNVTNSEALLPALNKLNNILHEYKQARSLPSCAIENINILPLNGKTSLKGRLESKNALLDHAGYNTFVEGFNSWVKSYDDEKHLLEALRLQIEETLLDPTLACIESKIGEDGNNDLSLLNGRLTMLEKQKRVLRQTASNLIRQEVVSVKPEISEVISSGCSQVELEASLQRIAGAVNDKVQSWLENEINDFRVAMVQATLNSLGIDKDFGLDDINDSNFANKLKELGVGQLKNLDADKITKLLLLGRKFKIPYLKGRWASTLGEWGKKLGPIVQVVLAVLEIFMANRGQNKENENKKQVALQLHQAVEQISSSIIGGLSNAVDEVVGEVMDEHINILKTEIDVLTTGTDAIQKDKQAIVYIKSSLSSVSF